MCFSRAGPPYQRGSASEPFPRPEIWISRVRSHQLYHDSWIEHKLSEARAAATYVLLKRWYLPPRKEFRIDRAKNQWVRVWGIRETRSISGSVSTLPARCHVQHPAPLGTTSTLQADCSSSLTTVVQTMCVNKSQNNAMLHADGGSQYYIEDNALIFPITGMRLQSLQTIQMITHPY